MSCFANRLWPDTGGSIGCFNGGVEKINEGTKVMPLPQTVSASQPLMVQGLDDSMGKLRRMFRESEKDAGYKSDAVLVSPERFRVFGIDTSVQWYLVTKIR